MATVTAMEGQSFLDLVVQTSGSIEAAFDFAQKNNISITDNPVVGKAYETVGVINKDVVNYYSNKGIMSATNASEDEVVLLGGIDYMGIEIDFIVS